MVNRTYRYFGGKPLYPFGYGLSYGKCAVTELAADRKGARIRVRNDGSRELEEVVELYIRDELSPLAPPNPVLCGFRRIRLAPGQETEVELPLRDDIFTLVDDEGRRVPGSGKWILYAGFGGPDSRTEELTGSKPLSVLISDP